MRSARNEHIKEDAAVHRSEESVDNAGDSARRPEAAV